MLQCPVCNMTTSDATMNDHLDICLEMEHPQANIFNNNVNDTNIINTDVVLTEVQQKAIDFCKKKSKVHSKQTKKLVLANVINMGYTEDDFNNMLKYVAENCQITINCPTKTILDKILSCEHFKNGYEIQRDQSYLMSRTVWENNLFNGIYDECEHIERPKYGALNLFNSKNGAAISYGKSYFILKNHVRDRISFTSSDSSQKMFHICTFNNCVPIFVHLQNQTLKNVIEFIKNKYKYIEKYSCGYIECQIHGMLKFNRDFEGLVCCEKDCTNEEKNKIKLFCENNNIKFITQ